MSSYALERSVAISAVIKASLLSQQVQKELIKEDDSLTKKDNSPVTGTYNTLALSLSLLPPFSPTGFSRYVAHHQKEVAGKNKY